MITVTVQNMSTKRNVGIAAEMANSCLTMAGETNVLRELLCRHTRPDLLAYFIALDRRTTDDRVVAVLGWSKCDRLYASGIEWFGQLVELSEDDLARRCGFTATDIEVLRRFLAHDKLAFGSDARRWKEYRDLVPEHFRLFQNDVSQEQPLKRGSDPQTHQGHAYCDLDAEPSQGRA